jgi:quinol-cytochrome oxidoreductase complex cytochrome b subunit
MIAPDETPDRLPITRKDPLYLLLALYALVGLLFGPVGRQVSDDMPRSKTHPYFPDHVWPYPILGMVVLITLGLLAFVAQPLLQPGTPADPRAAIVPRPEWYFLALFQFAKLGPALVTKMLVPVLIVVGLIFWPLLDSWLGPPIARRLGWQSWPVPKRNVITGTIWVAALSLVTLLTLWSAFSPELCLPWPLNGPVCGG